MNRNDREPFILRNPYSRLSPNFLNRDRTVPVRTNPKIRRNDKCPCGSGLKYKKCCINGNQECTMDYNGAWESICEGHKVCNENYSSDEYVFMNSDGVLETEDGCLHGGRFDEFWSVYQKNLSGNWYYYKNESHE